MNIVIKCEYAHLETSYDKSMIEVSLTNCDDNFVGDIELDTIIQGFDNQELFEKLIEYDEDLINNYLAKRGYLIKRNEHERCN